MANNFWGRLEELLGLEPRGLKAFQRAFRRQRDGRPVSAHLYDALNVWLEASEGNHGLPTATATGHKHIGLPLSQALVRETDRDGFGDLFALNSLPPRSSLPAFEMEALIEEWISLRPCPASNSLARLWKTGSEARARITEVAVLTLGSWDGTIDGVPGRGRTASHADVVRATVLLRTFPARSVDVRLVVPGQSSGSEEIMEVVDRNGSTLATLEMVPASYAYLGLADPESIDTASFLAGEVLLRRHGDGALLRRRGRRAIPMRRDDLLSAWVECERVQLAEEALVLIRHELAAGARRVLGEIARPGFVVEDTLPGLPKGWTVISSLQVVSSIPPDLRHVDLNVFQPLASSQVVMDGGLRIPGNIQKWSTLLPPEVRASSEGNGSLSARLVCTRELASPLPGSRKIAGTGRALVWDLIDEDLRDGDYEITVCQDDKPIRSITLRLRSADSPAVHVGELAPRIVHDPESLGFGLVACTRDAPGGFRGVCSTDSQIPCWPLPAPPAWYAARSESQEDAAPEAADRFQFPGPDADSCMVTGMHYIDIETHRKGMKFNEGVCRGCGLVKRYPPRPPRKKPKSGRRASNISADAPRIDVTALTPVRAAGTIDWRAAFDAVCHVGSGRASTLTNIAGQLEGTGIFGDTFQRRLELLAHIEIKRNSSQRIASWEVVEPLVVGLGDGSAVLAGFRSARMLGAVEDYVRGVCGSFEIEDLDGPPVVRIRGLTRLQFGYLARVMRSMLRREVRYVPRASEQLCAELPPLSQARRGLPLTTTTGARNCERWDPLTARFQQVADASAAGAFRLTGSVRQYIYRTARDVAEMRATVGDARIVKYLAAADTGLAIVGYDARTGVLYVPLGADLPGLYGRVAALCSGGLPRDNHNDQILEYPNVPPDVAAHLSHLLLN